MKKITWTKHSEKKIKEYNLSKNKIIKVIRKPYRIEKGIAPSTIALMYPIKKNKEKKWKSEIWVMIQNHKNYIKIISAWYYPGVSPITDPIPLEIIDELKKQKFI